MKRGGLMGQRKTIDFLITFDHDARKQISLEEFRNTAQALEAYSEREEQYRDNPRVEVVLLGAESIDAIKVTHSNYFEDTADAIGSLLASLGLEPNPVPND
jgi:tRNA nucleotidyltransferase (CCA-adding enzyme)